MSNIIGQNKADMANESLKVQQPHLESSSEMDELRCIIPHFLQSPKLP